MSEQGMIFEDKIINLPLVGHLIRHRFIKFGIVGTSGTIVNLIMLYLNQEVFLKSLTPPETRLKVSLAIAIFLATMNNFLLNRWWTWKDRKGKTRHGFFSQMCRYYVACALAIGLQYALTILLARVVHYLVSNITAIGLSAILVYVINDIWTFALRRRGQGRSQKRLSLEGHEMKEAWD